MSVFTKCYTNILVSVKTVQLKILHDGGANDS